MVAFSRFRCHLIVTVGIFRKPEGSLGCPSVDLDVLFYCLACLFHPSQLYILRSLSLPIAFVLQATLSVSRTTLESFQILRNLLSTDAGSPWHRVSPVS